MSAKTAADIRANDFRKSEPPKWIQAVLHRTWLVLIPLIAVSWYRTNRVEPAVKELETTIAVERAAAEKVRGDILSKRKAPSTRMSMLNALADTFAVRFEQIDSVLDSVRVLQSKDFAEKAGLEAQIDSLRTVYSESEGAAAQRSQVVAALQARVDSLRGAIEARDEERVRLESEAVSNQGLVERVLYPDKFRKTTALWTGAGQFPNRDSLKTR